MKTRSLYIYIYIQGDSERERGVGYYIRASADHSWAFHIIACIGQWVASPRSISYTRLVIR